jgi:hypothetical protein
MRGNWESATREGVVELNRELVESGDTGEWDLVVRPFATAMSAEVWIGLRVDILSLCTYSSLHCLCSQ